MSSYSLYISDDGTGIFRVVAINTPATLPAGGTRLSIPWIENYNAGTTGVVISSATTATPIVITTASAHGFVTGDEVFISGGLVENINGSYTFTKTGATTGSLDNSVGSGTYTASSATVKKMDSSKSVGIAIQAGLRAVLDDRASGN